MRVFVIHLVAIAIVAPFSARAQPAPVISDFDTARPAIAEHGMVVSQRQRNFGKKFVERLGSCATFFDSKSFSTSPSSEVLIISMSY
jgi:uncharacterized protein YfiM (DUF2279 family)